MRPAAPRALLLLACALLLLLGACRGFRGHPVRTSAGRLPVGTARADPGRLDEPRPPSAAQAPLLLFGGLEGVLARLAAVHAQPGPSGTAPRLVRLPRVEDSVLRRYAGGGFGGAVRSVVAVAASGRVPLRPAAMADLMGDPAVERQVLAAHAFRRLETVFALPGTRRERYRVELLGVGTGPFRYNLRFTAVSERLETSDGRVWLRYDPDARPRPEHVTLYRGGCVLEPDGDGTRVTELLILGIDLRLLPPFQDQLLRLARATLENRATNLWIRAWR